MRTVGPYLAIMMLPGLLASAALAAPVDFELPGTQPIGSGAPAAAMINHPFIAPDGAGGDSCDSCHGGSAEEGRPLSPWGGSMMSQAARDPLFYAQLDLALDDPNIRPDVDGMADMCLRCHSPVGWAEGRSTDLTGMGFNAKDMYGVQCHVCHRMVDPALAGSPDPDAANIVDLLAPDPGIPPTYGNGMYVLDPKHVRRGPYDQDQLTAHATQVVGNGPGMLAWTAVGDVGVHSHPAKGSTFHREGELCGTCHDVSNPADCEPGFDKSDTQQCFPIERTFTEWRYSDFYARGEAGNCQSCHMSGPLNNVALGSVCDGAGSSLGHLGDIHYHDLTGGNAFVPQVIIDMKQRYERTPAGITMYCASEPDPAACEATELAFQEAVDGLYPPASGNPFAGADPLALEAGIERVQRTLNRAAHLEVLGVSPDLSLRVVNRTGHKLPTGYPEGRRMWLNVKFLDANGSLLAESARYDGDDLGDPQDALLYHDQNLDGASGPLPYDVIGYTGPAGNEISGGRPAKVYEARVDYDPGSCEATDTCVEFHFTLNNRVRMDNRVPPEGWSVADYDLNRALPVIPTLYSSNGWQHDYGASGGPTSFHDDTDYPLPPLTDRVEITLYYQTASREYIEALVADNPNDPAQPATPTNLVAGGYNRATLMQEGWERNGRSAPVPMQRVVHAVVDGDGDGLSDGWETTFLSGVPAGQRGYSDDPDGDGLPNWMEFQADTDPADPADPGGLPDRDPVDIVLVLDMSGSMNNPAPGTSIPKIDVLKQSATLFLEAWRDYAIPADRLGVVYFRTNTSQFGGGALLKSFIGEVDNAIADINAQSASGWTAMGAGLYNAAQGMGAFDPLNPRNRNILLFSNGMQNRSPMVARDPGDEFPNHLYLIDQTPADNPDVTGDSDVTIGGSGKFPIPLGAGEIVKVHTVGIGVAENSGGTAWHLLLKDLAFQQTGKHNFVDQAFELEGVFLEDLVAVLRGASPAYVLEQELAVGQADPLEFPVNVGAKRFTVLLSWEDGSQPALELLRPDGTAEPLDRLTRSGSNYAVISRYLRDADRYPMDYGTWRLVLLGDEHDPGGEERAIARESRVKALRSHVIVDDHELDYRFRVIGARRVDEPLLLTARVSQGPRVIRHLDSARVTMHQPGAALGEMLARSRVETQLADSDAAATPFAAKLRASFARSEFVDRLSPSAIDVDLNDEGEDGDEVAGDGTFSARLDPREVPGHYRVAFVVQGHSNLGEPFRRAERRSLVLRTAPVDMAASVTTLADGELVLTPQDADGRLVGPGYASHLAVLAAGERLAVEDRLDGSYRFQLPTGFSLDTPVKLWLAGDRVHDGPLPEPRPNGLKKWWWLLLLILLLVVGLIFWLARR